MGKRTTVKSHNRKGQTGKSTRIKRHQRIISDIKNPFNVPKIRREINKREEYLREDVLKWETYQNRLNEIRIQKKYKKQLSGIYTVPEQEAEDIKNIIKKMQLSLEGQDYIVNELNKSLGMTKPNYWTKSRKRVRKNAREYEQFIKEEIEDLQRELR